MAMGHLRSLGFYVSRERLRNAVRVTDPINRALRWRGVLTARRPYSVSGPNALCHIGSLCSVYAMLYSIFPYTFWSITSCLCGLLLTLKINASLFGILFYLATYMYMHVLSLHVHCTIVCPLSLVLHYVMNIFFTDGHHKLVRWRLVTHAGIDSYSRLIVFLHCSNNNKASTVYRLFLKGIEQYGLPSCTRSDQGRENTMVAQHMLENRGL